MPFDFMMATQCFGWAAAVLTFLTFVSRDMRRLRVLALAANAAFVAYALLAGLWPVLALHLALAPINLWRLLQLGREPGPPAAPRPRDFLSPVALKKPRKAFRAIERTQT